VGVGHCGGDVRHLPQPHHGLVHRVPSQPDVGHVRRVHCGVGGVQPRYVEVGGERTVGQVSARGLWWLCAMASTWCLGGSFFVHSFLLGMPGLFLWAAVGGRRMCERSVCAVMPRWTVLQPSVLLTVCRHMFLLCVCGRCLRVSCPFFTCHFLFTVLLPLSSLFFGGAAFHFHWYVASLPAVLCSTAGLTIDAPDSMHMSSLFIAWSAFVWL